ncbi:hypothetical protein GIY62_00720 [Burkholderia plantarii]|uniref:hypothetical protein n=1 Tax=Burkholderia plantarii TaxID=41899 RepID=UPI00272AB4E2|nr:hypothetical protein [Burkholderia plantarii]WLE59263.1 hypothetical protein GIY62_00720 [Burkholderia plantarii]
MILPLFDPPAFTDLADFWGACTHADVRRLVLEVLHQRLTLMELSTHAGDAVRSIDQLDPDKTHRGNPVRKLRRLLEAEIQRAGPIGNSRDRVAQFSDEWYARQAVKQRLYDPPEPASADELAAVGCLPRFQRIEWRDLRAAWRATPPARGSNFTHGQRLVLEAATTRQVFRRLEKMAQQAHREVTEQDVESPALAELLRAISSEIDERGW